MFFHVLTHYSNFTWTGVVIFASNSWEGVGSTGKGSIEEESQTLAEAAVSTSTHGTPLHVILVRSVG